jgi:hypothetical protein
MSSFSEAVAPQLVRLVARAPDEGTRIDVFDGDLQPVPLPLDQNLGEVSLDLPRGVYSITFTRGNDSLRKTAVLTEGPVTIALSEEEAPRFVTAAPVRKTSSTREFHREPARALSIGKPRSLPGHAGGSRLLLFVRDINMDRGGDLVAGLSVRDLYGNLVYDLSQTTDRDASFCWAGVHLDLNPGAYLLCSELRSRPTQQAVYTRPGWQTQVFLLSRAAGGEGNQRRTDLSNVSLLMAKASVGFDFEREDSRWTEVALAALQQNGNLPGTVRTEMLWAKFQNPMLGIFGALLQLRRGKYDVIAMREVVRNLLNLVGPLPDVLAIGWALAARDASVLDDARIGSALTNPTGLETPPMLAESWAHLMRESEHHPDMIPLGSLSDRIGDLSWAPGPWLAWRGEPPKTVDLGDPSLELIKVARDTDARRAAEAAAAVPAPASAKDLAEPKKSSNLFSSLIEKLREPLSELTSALALPYLRSLLDNNPEAGYLLVSRRYTDLERRIAFFVSPLASPAVHEIMSSLKDPRAIEAALAEDTPAEGTIVQRTMEATGVPGTTLLRATWSVLKKLLLESVVPLKIAASSFADSETHGAEALRKILSSLAEIETPLRPKAGGKPVSALAFLCLYYRGSAAYPAGTKHTATSLVALLNDCDYVWSDELTTLSEEQLTTRVAELRERVSNEIAAAVERKTLDLPADWRKHVLPPLDSYERGRLLPAPRRDATPTPKASGNSPPDGNVQGAPSPKRSSQVPPGRKWSRIPDGSWLELQVDGEFVTARAFLVNESGYEIRWPHVASRYMTRQILHSPEVYSVRVEIGFAGKSSADLLCRIVKTDGSVFGKPYRLAVSGNAGDVVSAEISAVTLKS